MSDEDNIVVSTAERIFADLADLQEVAHARGDAWKAPLWRALTEAGLPLAWVSEQHGGSGASLIDGFAVLRAAGRSALAAPLAETMLAGWLLSQGGIVAPEGMMTVVPGGSRELIALAVEGRLTGHARRIPFARDAAHFAVLAESASGLRIALVDASLCRIDRFENLAGDAADTVSVAGVHPVAIAIAPDWFDPTSLFLMGSAVRSQQISGALEAMLELSVLYSTERVAFERTISRYQAVQHNLAQLGGEVAAAVAAATSAADAMGADPRDSDGLLLEVASAKIRCGEAADKGAAIAHQVHGAIGFTTEHVLHRLTLRALAWRDDFGSESYWSSELGRWIGRRGADELWPLIASR
ncbi:acyl-CoA dehydrogenase [Bradyrhizobium sp. LB8.2]|uniref:acyl-CoA dehydrogenase family protein n=1 Tax=unclassified Bradyrhizobium TaxID=2631580 RepID=UPI003394A618